MTTTKPNIEAAIVIEGHTIQIDRSGVGHCWEVARGVDCLPSIQEEIAAEIIDGGRESGEYTATNGVAYRW